MSSTNGKASNVESALWRFRCVYGALVRALDAGEMEAVAARDDSHGLAIEIDGTSYVLREKIPGSLDARIKNEPAESKRFCDGWNRLIKDRNEAVALCKEMLAMVKAGQTFANKKLLDNAAQLLAENQELKAALSPYEETFLTARRDEKTGELIGSHSIKKLR
jgi:hypothetical protein